jgi:glycosyltransferase involved in cell wall biosynthesis
MVLQEAGALGIPCITTDTIGPKEFGIPGKTGLLVKKADVDDLYQKMLYFYEDRTRIECFSKAMYEMVKERYERGVMVQRILDDRNLLWEEYNTKKK